MKTDTRSQRGSIVIYILIAIFLTGLLVAALTTGSDKSATSQQLDAAMLYVQADIKTIQSAVTSCAIDYPTAVDVNNDGATNATDNPNPPFPLYCANGTCALSTMASGSSGVAISLAGCPGAPDGQRPLFATGALKVLGDTSSYTTTFFNDSTEGLYMRIERVGSDPLWLEAISRLETKYSTCSAVSVTSNPDPLTHDCSGGCFYYWFLRRGTSSSSFEVGCP